MEVGSSSLGPRLYHWIDNDNYAQWLRNYPELAYDMMVTSYHKTLRDEMDSSRNEEYSLLESCEVFTDDEWLRGGLTPWVEEIEEGSVNLIHVDETHDDGALLEAARLKIRLHFKTTSTCITVGQDVKDYAKVPLDLYRNTEEQTHMSEADWKYVDVRTKNDKVMQIKMGFKLEENEIKEYNELVDEFSDTFAWS